MKKILLSIARFLVGILFIFSGLIKANDPLGLSYKMQEFFDVWHLPAFNQFSLVLAVLMIIFEIVAGVAVLLGWRMQLFAWLLLLLILFFSFLTGYAVISGKIRECGCFGDCIPLQAMGSFIKDLILLGMILFLFAFRKEIKPLFSRNSSLLVLAFSLILSFSFQWYVLQYLPLVDCLPYRIGANIPEKMKPPAGSVPDSTVIHFVYEKNKQQVEYTADQLPADFDDSYHFIKRYDKLIRKGNAEPAIKDFSLASASGNDSTSQILDRPGYKLFVIARNFTETDPSWNKAFSVWYALAKSKNIPVYFITSARAEANAYLQANNLAGEIPVFTCDATAIKTAARADPVLYLLKKGTILQKWSYAAFESAVPEISALPLQSRNLATMISKLGSRFSYAGLVMAGVVVLVFILFQGFGDPARLIMGQRADAGTLHNIRKELYLDQPKWKQFLFYLNDISPVSLYSKEELDEKKISYLGVGGNRKLVLKFPYLRRSYQTRKGVWSMLMDALPGTILLALAAMCIATVLGIALGVIAAVKKNTWMDTTAIFSSVLGISAPSFFMSIVIAYVFGFVLSQYTGLPMTGSLFNTDPFEGRQWQLKNLILPAITLGIRPMAIIAQLTRGSLLDTLNQDYIRTAYAKGLSARQVIVKHALRNALNPVITAITGWFAELLAGAFFVEYIFGWKGIGKLTVDALAKLDFPVVMGSVLVSSFFFIAINMLADWLYRAVDPRVT